jgi:hypothetical protein
MQTAIITVLQTTKGPINGYVTTGWLFQIKQAFFGLS